jgi:hypothetical protein
MSYSALHLTLVDLVLLFLLLEVAVFSIVLRRRLRFRQRLALTATLGSGAAFALAVRLAMSDASFLLLGLCFLASLGFHLLDLAVRLCKGAPEP